MDNRVIAIVGFGLIAFAAAMCMSTSDADQSVKAGKTTQATSPVQVAPASRAPEVPVDSQVQQVAYQQSQQPYSGSSYSPSSAQPRQVSQWPSRYPLNHADVKAPELTDDEVTILGQLPPVCVSELPGLNHSDPNTSQNFQPGTNRSTMQAAGGVPNHQAAMIGSDDVGGAGTIAQSGYNAGQVRQYPLPGEPNVAPTVGRHLDSLRVANRMEGMVNPHASASMSPTPRGDGEDPHLEIYSRSAFPSAEECASCHKQIYDEWASSSHAYAAVSPMFHKFENTINKLAQGTIGYFCMRCHAPVATTMGLRRDQPIWDGPKVFREGVTCVACHRVKTPYGKVNGERRIEPGGIHDPVYGASDGSGAALANKYSEFYKTKSDPTSKALGQPIHRRAIQFEELSESTFCMSCHQVAVQPGIKLEVVWDQYRASPAYREGVTCQDCHMGIEPGLDEGYSYGPAAVVDKKVVNPERKHSNHMFYGPGYSIAHPGVFPQTKESNRWKFNDWLLFDWRAGWGTEKFEEALEEGQFQAYFPAVWQDADDRYDAREIIDANLSKLKYKHNVRKQLMENGSKLDGPFFANDPQVGRPLKFRYCVTNMNSGHNMPSGSLGAQPQLWLNTVLIDPCGQPIWESGYLDSNGDLCDQHSLDVLNRKLPLDKQLFNLQTKFLTTNVKGTDREMYLPVNVDIDQLPFLRPAAQPVSVINHPPFIRMEAHSIAPLGSRNAKYVVPAHLIREPGTYRLSVRMRSRAEPIYFMRFCNATPEMERMMNEWILSFHEHSVTFEVR